MGVVNIFVKCSCRCQDIANLSSGYFRGHPVSDAYAIVAEHHFILK